MIGPVIVEAFFEDGDNDRLSLLGGNLFGVPDLRKKDLNFFKQLSSSKVDWS